MTAFRRTFAAAAITLLQTMIVTVGGCAARGSGPAGSETVAAPATRPATAADPRTAEPAYWLEQPAAASVESRDFERLWSAAEEAVRDFHFRIDRTDLRAGLITTEPLTSAQWFEPWRRDTRSFNDTAESSLATMRRTLRFEFDRLDDGTYRAVPRVLVERQALAEQRVTSAVSYRQIFRRPVNPAQRQRGTRESDAGVILPHKYWYAVGRDEALERALTAAIERKLRGG